MKKITNKYFLIFSMLLLTTPCQLRHQTLYVGTNYHPHDNKDH